VVAADVEGLGARAVRALQSDLAGTYRDDFAKYAARIDPRNLDLVLQGVVTMLGGKFVASRIGEGLRHQPVYRALELLGQARLCHEILHTAANGLPLGGEVNPRLRKFLMLDVGLVHAWMGTPGGRAFPQWGNLAPKVRGQLTEQLVGQQLHALTADPDGTTRLYYWQREGGRAGEIDYVAALGAHIVPIELKSGTAGAMKSLHQFMFDKRLPLAVRFDANPPSLQQLSVKTTHGDPVKYRLLNLPHYLAWRVGDLVEEVTRRRPPRR
jgi:predicted AAA+ superfamily ATPase